MPAENNQQNEATGPPQADPVVLFATEEENTQALIQHMLAQDEIEAKTEDSADALSMIERQRLAESTISGDKQNLYDEILQAQMLEEIAQQNEFGLD